MKFKGILLDLDGTLLNTLPDISAATNAMLMDLGLPSLAMNNVGKLVGKGTENLVLQAIKQQCDDASVDLIMRGLARFRDHYLNQNGQLSKPYPYVQRGLAAFASSGTKLALVTNKPAEFTLPLIQHMGWHDLFAATVCGDTCERKKPDPLPLFHACDLLAIRPDQALMIGDSANDALAAQAAGISMLVVPYGYNQGIDVRTLPANAIVQNLLEAVNWAHDIHSS